MIEFTAQRVKILGGLGMLEILLGLLVLTQVLGAMLLMDIAISLTRILKTLGG